MPFGREALFASINKCERSGDSEPGRTPALAGDWCIRPVIRVMIGRQKILGGAYFRLISNP